MNNRYWHNVGAQMNINVVEMIMTGVPTILLNLHTSCYLEVKRTTKRASIF